MDQVLKEKKELITAFKDQSIPEVAKLMKEKNVGTVIILEDQNTKKPIGMVTDRDLALKVIAEGGDPTTKKLEEVMSSDLCILNTQQSKHECIKAMKEKGIRRAPVMDENNQLCSLVSIDDLFLKLREELGELAELVKKQVS